MLNPGIVGCFCKALPAPLSRINCLVATHSHYMNPVAGMTCRVDSGVVGGFYKALRCASPEEFGPILKDLRTELGWLESHFDDKGGCIAWAPVWALGSFVAPGVGGLALA